MSRRPRPDADRARRVLVVAGLVIVAGQLATGLALDAAPPAVRFAQGGKVLSRASALGDTPYVLLLGSSRFWMVDVDAVTAALRDAAGAETPAIVQGAVLGGDPIVADYLLEKLLVQGSRPALLAVEISPESVAYPAPWIAGQAIRFFTWSDIAAWTPEIVARGKMVEVAAARLSPIDTYRRELLTWIVGRPPPYLRVTSSPRTVDPVDPKAPQPAADATDTSGGPREPGGGANDTATGQPPNGATLSGLRQVRGWLRDYRVGGGAARALERFLARARDADIPVVLVGPPASSWLRELYTPAVERTFRDYLDDLRRRYGTQFADYRARISDRFFTDHYHLNARGGALFARMLASEVLAVRWHEARLRDAVADFDHAPEH